LTLSSFELEFKGGRAQRRRYLEEEGVKGGDFRRRSSEEEGKVGG
jgi:hypothetical protein